MGTWLIVRRLWMYANWSNHLLVRRELQQESPWLQPMARARQVYRYIVWVSLGILIVATVLEAFEHSQVSFLTTMLMIALPVAGLAFLSGIIVLAVGWTIVLTLAGSTIIVRERVARTWDMLLTTPIPRAELLLAKLAVGMMRQQSFLTAAVLCQFVPLIILIGQVGHQYERKANGVEGLVIVLLAIGLFVFERLQQIALNGLLGLTASLIADSWALAVIGAAALGAVSWLAHVVLTFGLTVAIAGEGGFDIGQTLVIGVPSLILAPGSPPIGVALVFGLLIVQELIVRRLFTWLIGHIGG